MKLHYYLFGLVLTTSQITQVQAVNVLIIDVRNRFIASSQPISDETSAPLTTGDLVQLGYFETTTAPTTSGAAAFSNFVPLTDPAGTLAATLASDNAGTFLGQVALQDDINAPSAPSLNLQFALRFYNSSTVAGATFFNTVTTPDWTFSFVDQAVTPPPLPSLIDLSGFNNASNAAINSAVWEGVPFQTTIANTAAIPEPSSSILLLGAGLLLGARRRK